MKPPWFEAFLFLRSTGRRSNQLEVSLGSDLLSRIHRSMSDGESTLGIQDRQGQNYKIRCMGRISKLWAAQRVSSRIGDV